MLKKLSIFGLVFLIIVVLLIVFIPFTYSRAEIIKEYDTGVAFSYDKLYPVKGGYQGVNNIFQKTEIVLSKFHIISPTYTILRQDKGDNKSSYLTIVRLQRERLFFWKVKNVINATSKNIDFEQLKNLAQENDLSASDKFPSTIILVPQPSDDEIKNRQEASKIYNNPKYEEGVKNCAETTRDKDALAVEDCLNKLNADLKSN